MIEALTFDTYTAHVWTAYAVTGLLVAGLVVWSAVSTRRAKRTAAQLAALLKHQQAPVKPQERATDDA